MHFLCLYPDFSRYYRREAHTVTNSYTVLDFSRKEAELMSAEELKKTRKRKTTSQKKAAIAPETESVETGLLAKTRKKKTAAAPETASEAKKAGR
jgi:hypothetical protein